MRKFGLLLTISYFLLFGCTKPEKVLTREEIIRSKLERVLFPKLNDTTSYQFVSLVFKDSTLYKENIERVRRDLTDISFEQSMLGFGDKKYQLEIDKKKRKVVILDSVNQVLGDKVNKVAAYTYLFSFRAKNRLGALVLGEYLLQITPAPEYEVLAFSDKKGDMLVTPNTFPMWDIVNR
jgi:hypothetical protein